MKIISLVLLLIKFYAVISKESYIKCNYRIDEDHGYTCNLKIHNPAGLNNFNVITGDHLNHFNNDEVRFLFKNYEWEGHTINIPKIICEQFPNLKDITLRNIKLERIDNDSFSKCKKLLEILSRHNNLNVIEENALLENTELRLIRITMNEKPLELPEEFFINQKKVELICLDSNKITDLPKNIFKSQKQLQELCLGYNNIRELRPEWFENLESLMYLHLQENPIEYLPVNVFSNLKSLVRIYMHKTRLKVIHSSSFGVHPHLKIVNFKSSNIFAIQRDFLKNNYQHIDIFTNIHGCGIRSLTRVSASMGQHPFSVFTHHITLKPDCCLMLILL